MDDDFTIVKAKKKSSKNNNMEYSAKKQKIDEATPWHNKFDRLTIEDVPTTSGNEMDVSPLSPTARKTPHHPRVLDEGHHSNTLLDPPALHPELKEVMFRQSP
ncbi:hypothetical protein NPIL_527301 [Nephila pilipes]|uniref:Uncharacterized protein n=1 Tax=Nephila pilipes TaxID=299642 RepID=A0A8X6Q1F9_NEPPI|nr:hypothetical protein NPIL_527301 [Nephila pilipes]